MSLPGVIFDNTVFNFFVRFKSIELQNIVRNIVREGVFVPQEVLNEMEFEMELFGKNNPEYQSKIMYWGEQIRANNFFKLCNTYDRIVFDFVKSKLDKGEADAVAQSQRIGIKYFITDDRKCLPFINDNYKDIKTNSTFFLLSLADIIGIIPDYDSVFYEYHQLIMYDKFNKVTRKEHKARLRSEYKLAMKHYGLAHDSKLISTKTSVDTILRRRVK